MIIYKYKIYFQKNHTFKNVLKLGNLEKSVLPNNCFMHCYDYVLFLKSDFLTNFMEEVTKMYLVDKIVGRLI